MKWPLCASFIFAVLLVASSPHPASAQYMYLDADGDGASTASDTLRVPGTTTLDIWLDTNHNKDGTPATCGTGQDMTINSYSFLIQAIGGTVAWGPYANNQPVMGINAGEVSSPTLHLSAFAGGSPLAAGKYKLGSISVFVTSGRPRIAIAAEDSVGNHPTLFGTACSGSDLDNTAELGVDWSDVDGVAEATSSVVNVETFDSTFGVLPSVWASTGYPTWHLTNCDVQHYLGSFSAQGSDNVSCCSYLDGVDNALYRSPASFVSQFHDYRMSFLEIHNFDPANTGDTFSYTFKVGTFDPPSTVLPSTVLYGGVTGWTRRTSSSVDNSLLTRNYATPLFGVRTSAASGIDACYGVWVDSIQVYGTRFPDLKVVSTSVTPTGGASSLVAGDAASFWVTITNDGDLKQTNSYTTRVRLKRTSDGQMQTAGSFTVSAQLSYRDTFTQVFNYNVPEEGTYQVLVDLDTGNTVRESDVSDVPETNNAYTSPTSYTWAPAPKPDLVVLPLAVSNGLPSLGDTVVVTAVVQNKGQGSAGASELGFYLNPGGVPNQGTPPTQVAEISALASSETDTVYFSVMGTVLKTDSLYALADRTGSVLESNSSGTGELDNVAGPTTLTWQSGAFSVRGVFVYDDSTNGNQGTNVPCSRVEVWHHDAVGLDSLLATGTVNGADGSYLIGPIANVDATPPPGGDAILDVYVRWVFQSNEQCWGVNNPDQPIVTMLVGDSDSLWHFDSGIVVNMPNKTYNFGVLRPIDYEHRSAAHIFDRVQRAWQYFGYRYRSQYGSPGPITVRWEEGYPTVTAYDEILRTMFVSGELSASNYTPDEWNNWTIAHEYGHHLSSGLGALPAIPSDSIKVPHFLSDPAGSMRQAWDEGFSDLIGNLLGGYPSLPSVATIYGRDFDGSSHHLVMNLEDGSGREYVGGSPTDSFTVNDAGPLNELSVAAALWDVQDDAVDNPNGDTYADYLSGGWGVVLEEILKYSAGQIRTVCDYGQQFQLDWCCDQDYLMKERAVLWEHGMFCEALGNPTGVGDDGSVRHQLELHRAQPNPFNPRTRIRYELPDGTQGRVALRIFDTAGRLLRTLVDRSEVGGFYEAVWDGATDAGLPVASGIYFCQLKYEGQRRTQRVTLLR